MRSASASRSAASGSTISKRRSAAEPGAAGAPRRCARCSRHVVVVAACREEHGLPAVLGHQAEADPVAIELGARGDVGDLQVHVAHRRAIGLALERRRLGIVELAEQPVEIERVGAHALRDLALPELARPVVVDLDAVLVGIAEVDGLADEVVGGAREPHALAYGVREPARQAGPVGQQQGEVEEPRAPRRRLRARLLDELEQARPTSAERCAAVALREHGKADGLAVVGQRALEVGDRQVHRAHVRRRRGSARSCG